MKQQTTLKGSATAATAGAMAWVGILAAARLSIAAPDFKLGGGIQTVNARSGHPENILPTDFPCACSPMEEIR
jgi:hypothetical protein